MSPIFSQPVIRHFGLAGAFGVTRIITLLLAAVFVVVARRESADETVSSTVTAEPGPPAGFGKTTLVQLLRSKG